MINKLNERIRLKLLKVMNPLTQLFKSNTEKSIILIRLDAIGDYVLFRNFIDEIKKSKTYCDYKITLLGNSAWKNLAVELDSKYIEKFIWLDRKKFSNDLDYRYNKLKEITTSGYEVAINSVYSRESLVDDIIKLIYAKEKIGSLGDLSNISKTQKEIGDKYYTKLLEVKKEIMFEFDRNKEFFENLLENNIETKCPHISLKSKKSDFDLPKKYAILFIGASSDYRKWNIKNFAEVGKHLKNEYGYEIVLCGSSEDSKNALEFKKHFRSTYVDLVGKTSLVDLFYIISNGSFMLSNETSAPHLAVSLGVSYIFVIYNGNHYGRFVPYPKDIAPDYHVVYHPEIEKDLDDYRVLSNKYEYSSELDINDITPLVLTKKIDKILNI